MGMQEAEGVDDEEADRYLSLLDPAQAALLHGTSEVDDGEIEDEEEEEEAAEPLQHSPSKASKLDTAGTVRAQMQEKAAQRAQRIKYVFPGSFDYLANSPWRPQRRHGQARIRECLAFGPSGRSSGDQCQSE